MTKIAARMDACTDAVQDDAVRDDVIQADTVMQAPTNNIPDTVGKVNAPRAPRRCKRWGHMQNGKYMDGIDYQGMWVGRPKPEDVCRVPENLRLSGFPTKKIRRRPKREFR